MYDAYLDKFPHPGTGASSQESAEPDSGDKDQIMEVDEDPEIQKALEAVQKQDVIVQYLGDCILFTEQMHRVILLVSQLLASKSTSDILESIDFLGGLAASFTAKRWGV